jgi:hypothetical protein
VKYEGNLVIRTPADAKEYQSLTEITGHLYIYAPAKLDAPKLESVGGYLSINAPAKLDAPKLESVGGDLYIYAPAKLDAPKLESVGGNLYINAPAKLDAPKLESVGGHLYIYAPAKLDALKSVGGDLYIYAKGALTADRLYAGGYDKFTVIDGIGCVVLSEKTQGGATIRLCRHSKIKDQKVVGDKFFVASQNGHHAHGKTIAEATQELAFKTGSRDVSQWKNLPATTIKTPKEWAFVYRMITGACQYGTERFMADKGKLKKRYTLAEIVAETKGAFGHERFREVVGSER